MRAAGSGLPELKSLLASELKYEESEKLVQENTNFLNFNLHQMFKLEE